MLDTELVAATNKRSDKYLLLSCLAFLICNDVLQARGFLKKIGAIKTGPLGTITSYLGFELNNNVDYVAGN